MTLQYLSKWIAVPLLLCCAAFISWIGEPGRTSENQDDANEATALVLTDIDLATANRFHAALDVLCVQPNIQVAFDGPLGDRRGVQGLKRYDGSDTYTTWSVVEVPADSDGLGELICQLRLCLKRVTDSDIEYELDGKTFFIQILSDEPEEEFNERIRGRLGNTIRELMNGSIPDRVDPTPES